jgi:hypothetical protein
MLFMQRSNCRELALVASDKTFFGTNGTVGHAGQMGHGTEKRQKKKAKK